MRRSILALAFVQRPLAAGQERLAVQQDIAPADFSIASIAFAADGTFRSIGQNGTETGTWVTAGDGQVTLTSANSAQAYRYEI